MAAAALIACADGSLTPTKRKAVAAILETMEPRGAVDPAAAGNLFNSFTNGIRSQPGLGRSAALRAVAAVAGDAEGAQRLLRICRAISGAHGGIQDGAQGGAQDGPSARDSAVIEEIRAVLDVPAPEVVDETFANRDGAPPGPFVITLGNEKGGTGKSTAAMHLAVALLKLGYKVGTIDLDGRQGTLSRYLTNRRALAKTIHRDVPMPLHRRIEGSEADQRQAAESEDKARFGEALVELADRQIVIVDTPGSDSYLSRLAHANADMLITPINDTLLDIDILAHIDPSKREVRAPSAYCQMVWKQNDRRRASGREPIDWIVMRNRLTHIDAHNKRAVADLLDQLAERLGFRLATGFGERVIFHELFLTGLTVLDLPDDRLRGWSNVSLSHARREIHDLLLAVGVPESELARSIL